MREAASILDLDLLILPCPKRGPTWRPQAIERGGKRQFPYMVDDNTGTALYESDAIVSYLFATYGDGRVPLPLCLGPLTTLTCVLALAPRLGAGGFYHPSRLPKQPLVLWGSGEVSPFAKVARRMSPAYPCQPPRLGPLQPALVSVVGAGGAGGSE